MLSDEELTLLSPPYPSSITSRPQARRLVEACEMAEMIPPYSSSATLTSGADGAAGTRVPSGGVSETDGVKSEVSPYILVIEMASLIYLGEYVHAKHLWTRSRDISSTINDSGENEKTSEDPIQTQLELLYNAARCCQLWATGGLYPLEVGVKNNGGNNNMQVEDSEPYSTMAIKAFQSCIDSGLQPCASYGAEVMDAFRIKVNQVLHQSFGRIKLCDLLLRMQMSEENVSGYGWIPDSSAEYLIPSSDWEPVHEKYEDEDHFVTKATHEDVMHQMLSDGERVKQLSSAVMFMEQTRMNA